MQKYNKVDKGINEYVKYMQWKAKIEEIKRTRENLESTKVKDTNKDVVIQDYVRGKDV